VSGALGGAQDGSVMLDMAGGVLRSIHCFCQSKSVHWVALSRGEWFPPAACLLRTAVVWSRRAGSRRWLLGARALLSMCISMSLLYVMACAGRRTSCEHTAPVHRIHNFSYLWLRYWHCLYPQRLVGERAQVGKKAHTASVKAYRAYSQPIVGPLSHDSSI
jgi:hypothetical protein